MGEAVRQRTARALRGGLGEDLQVEFFIEHGDVTLRGAHQQLGGHGDKDAVVAGGVITQGVAQRRLLVPAL